MLISVHLPKTAGSSFREELRRQFGAKLVLDYERPMHLPTGVANARALLNCGRNAFRRYDGVDCIHGHFLPLKYRWAGMRRGATFVTWMRDPVERLVSHYHFWLRETGGPDPSALRKRVVAEQWTLERFCLCPERRNIYTRYLWGMPLDRFAFVGITEFYDPDLEYFAGRYLPRPVGHLRVNAAPSRSERGPVLDPSLRRKIEAYHHQDLALYRRALELRSRRA